MSQIVFIIGNINVAGFYFARMRFKTKRDKVRAKSCTLRELKGATPISNALTCLLLLNFHTLTYVKSEL